MPILGYDIVGGSSWGGNDAKMGSPDDTDGIGGVITKFHVAINSIFGSAPGIKLAVVNADQVTGDPKDKTIIEQVEFDVEVSDNNEIVAPEGNELLADTKYWVGFITESSSGTEIKYDSGDTAYYRLSCVYGDEFVSPWQNNSDNIARLVSVWVDYQHPGVLGYDTVGLSSMGNAVIVYGGSHSTYGNGGIIQAFHVAIAQVYGPLDAVKIVVADCKQDDGDPSGKDVIEQIEIHPVIVSDDNEAAAVGSNNLEADTKYYIGILSASGATKWKYDSGVGVTLWYDALAGVDYATWFPDPCRTPYSSSGLYGWSVWVDYEGIGGQEFVRSIVDTIGVTDSLLRSVIFTRKIVDTINISDVLISVRIKVRKIIDTVGITDILSYVSTVARKTDSFSVCQIIKVKEKSIGALREVVFPKISKVVQNVAYNNPKVKQIKKYMKPIINEIRGIKK